MRKYLCSGLAAIRLIVNVFILHQLLFNSCRVSKCLLFSLPCHVLLKTSEKSPKARSGLGWRPATRLLALIRPQFVCTESIFIHHASLPFSYYSRFFCLSVLSTRRVPAYQHRPRLIPRNPIVRSTRLDEARYWNSAHA
jgi:uncharacterized membrane protein